MTVFARGRGLNDARYWLCHWMLNSIDGIWTLPGSRVDCIPGDTKMCVERLWCAPISRRLGHFAMRLTGLYRKSRKRANPCGFAPSCLFVKPVHAANLNQLKRAASFSCSFSRNSSSSSASGLTESSSCSVRMGAAPRLPRSLPNKCSRA